jgi:hypothetical protein
MNDRISEPINITRELSKCYILGMKLATQDTTTKIELSKGYILGMKLAMQYARYY